MENKIFQLRRVRDFSANMSDLFEFIKQEWKMFFKGLLLIVGPFVLLAGIIFGVFYGGMMGRVITAEYSTASSFTSFSYMGVSYSLIMLSAFLMTAALSDYVASYLKSYEENGMHTPDFSAIWQLFKSNFFAILGYNLLYFLMIGLGMVLCILPGIYLAICLAIYPFVYMNEGSVSIGKRCFDLIRDHFWETFGLYILLYLIAQFSGSFAGLILGGGSGLLSYFVTKDVGNAIGLGYGIVMVLTYLMHSVVMLAMGLNYYSRVEALDGVGLMAQIENIGTTEEEE